MCTLLVKNLKKLLLPVYFLIHMPLNEDYTVIKLDNNTGLILVLH